MDLCHWHDFLGVFFQKKRACSVHTYEIAGFYIQQVRRSATHPFPHLPLGSNHTERGQDMDVGRISDSSIRSQCGAGDGMG